MPWGELAGLSRDSFDLRNGVIRVDPTWVAAAEAAVVVADVTLRPPGPDTAPVGLRPTTDGRSVLAALLVG